MEGPLAPLWSRLWSSAAAFAVAVVVLLGPAMSGQSLAAADVDPPADPVSVDDLVVENSNPDLGDWIAAGIVLAVSCGVALITRRAIRQLAEKTTTVTSTVQVVARISSAVIISIGIYAALTIIGINLAPLLAGAGILSIVLGFALKDVAENYVAGILMGFNNPFSPGDQIIIDEGRLEGEVVELQLRYTVVRSTDGVKILMPNSLLIKNPLENLTVNGSRRSHFTIGVAFGTDLDEARRIAVDAVKSVEGVHDDPEPEAFVEELGGSWVTIRIRFWHGPRNHDRWQVRGRAITTVFSAINDAGIDMPFRHNVVTVEGAQATPPPTTRSSDNVGFVDDRSGDGSDRGQ